MEKRIKDIIKADLANAGEGFENNYPLYRDNWICVYIFGGRLYIDEHVNGSYLSDVNIVDTKDNFDAAWERFIAKLKLARKIRWKAGYRKISLGIRDFLGRLGELECA